MSAVYAVPALECVVRRSSSPGLAWTWRVRFGVPAGCNAAEPRSLWFRQQVQEDLLHAGLACLFSDALAPHRLGMARMDRPALVEPIPRSA